MRSGLRPARRQSSALPCSGGDLGGEIGFLLLDSLAQSIAHKTGNLDRRTGLALSFLDGLGDALLVVEDEGLFQQGDFLEEGLDARIDDLLDHRVRLALL